MIRPRQPHRSAVPSLLLLALAACGADEAATDRDTTPAILDPDVVVSDTLGVDTLGDEDTAPPDTRPLDTTEPADTADTEVIEDTGPVACAPVTLAVVALDVWARPLEAPKLLVDGAATGEEILALCDAERLEISASTPLHHAVTVTVDYDGLATLSSLSTRGDLPRGAGLVATFDPATARYTLYLGLPHRWFAASGAPPRPGSAVTLYTNGRDAWAQVAKDLASAVDLVTMTSWWWHSDFELVRGDADAHPLWPASARADNTIMARLEALTGVAKKVIVSQFVSQDGLLSSLNVDDALVAHGATAGDGFDYLGQFNDASGQFTVTQPPPDFAARLAALTPELADETIIEEAEAASWVGSVDVDAADLPYGLSILDVPLASWHQKFTTIDQRVAFIGGMNVQHGDWDTSEHAVFDPRRMPFDASQADRLAVLRKDELPELEPRRDFMTRIEGPAVADAVALFDRRWSDLLAQGVDNADNATPLTLSAPPDPIPGGVELQVVTTMPPPAGEHEILETLQRAISQAERYILIEDQYFRSPLLRDAIIARMKIAEALQLIVITNDIDEWTDPACWPTFRQHEALETHVPDRYSLYQLRSFDHVARDCVFCIDEVDGYFVSPYIHSKLVVIDDVYLQIGSANHNNRGMLYEGELAVAVYDPSWVRDQRDAIVRTLLGSWWYPGVSAEALPWLFDAAAQWNQDVYDRWDDAGYDLDLDGAPLPESYRPDGLLYPLDFDEPSDCLIEGVGDDVT